MPLHADPERLDPAEGEPTVERTGDRTERVLGEFQLLVQVLAVRDDGSPEEVGMATDVLRRAVNDQVHAQPEWVLQRGRPERVVADADRIMSFRDHGELLQVDDFHQRVRRRFHPDHLRFRTERILHVHEVAEVQEGRFDSVSAHDPGEDSIHAPVAVVRDDRMVSLLQEREGRCDGAHPAREGQRTLSRLQSGEALLQRVPRRVRTSSVDVLGLRLL